MRQLIVGGLLAVSAISLACAQDRPATSDLRTRTFGSDWPKFLGPTGDSKSSEKGILTKWPAAGPKIVWQHELGAGYAPPTISRGRLYEFSRHRSKNRLTCLKSETGEELWRFEYPSDYDDYFGYDNGPRCCPVVDDDRVYFYGPEGTIHCLGALDGKPLWKVDTKRQFNVVQNFFGVGSTPLIEGDLLITVVGGSPADTPRVGLRLDLVKGNGCGVVAFDKRSGEVKYKLSDELAGYASPMAVTVGDRRWCFVFARGGLLGFEPASGKLDFHFPWRDENLESVNASNPVVVGDRVFISECYGIGSALVKFKPGACETIWTDERKGRGKSLLAHWNTPIYVDGYLYGCSGRHTGGADLRCVEFDTGKVTWHTDGRQADDELPFGRSSLLYVDGHLICLTERGELIVLKANPKKYEPVSRVLLRDKGGTPVPGFGPPPLLEWPAWAAPVLSHGLLYVRGKDRLVCLELMAK